MSVPDGQVPVVSEPPPSDRVPPQAWRRMHPVTPALKGWKIFVGVLLVASYQLSDDVRRAAELLEGHGWLLVLGGLLLVAVVGFAYSAVAWRVTRFAVTDEAVHLQTGILFRQQRQARLDRLQAVDVVQPLLARLVGLSELKLEVAGGSGSAVSLAFLREAEADALRAELLALAAGLQRPTAPTAPAAPATAGAATADAAVVAAPAPAFEVAPEHQVYEVPMSRLVVSTLQSSATVAFAVLVIAAVVTAVASRSVGAAFFVVPMVFGVGSFLWTRINQGASFGAATSPDGIRLRHGFTESRAQTVPPGRVQAVRISQGLWWRWSGWWRVEINVAGYGHDQKAQQQDTVLHPVATVDEVMTALWLVLPDLGVADPRAVVAAGLTGTGTDGGFTAAPRAARWVDPVGWRRHGVLVTDRALLTRSGRLRRQVDVVPHERTQSLGLEQGPLQRRLGVATFVVHSTPGPVLPRVEHLDESVALALLDEQAERARSARAADRPEQWMRAAELRPVEPTPSDVDAAQHVPALHPQSQPFPAQQHPAEHVPADASPTDAPVPPRQDGPAA